MRRADILLLHGSDELYGADRVLLAVANALARSWVVEVWLPTDVEYPEHKLCSRLKESGISVQHRPMPVLRRAWLTPRSSLGVLRRCAITLALLAETRPRVLWLNTSALSLAVPLGRLVRARVVIHLHEIPRRKEARLLAAMIGPAHRIVAVSEATRRAFGAVLGERARVVTNAVPGPAGAETAPAAPTLRILFVGRWTMRKGVLDLIEAVTSSARSDVMLTVLGGPPPTGKGVDVIAAAQSDGRIRIVGEVDDVTPYLLDSHVLVVPSREADPSPLVVREAAAWARPALVTRAGGLPELVDDGVTGWIVRRGDVAALREAIEGISADAIHKRGAAARARWEREWQPEAFEATVLAIATDELARR